MAHLANGAFSIWGRVEAAGRLLEGAGDRAPRGMTVRGPDHSAARWVERSEPRQNPAYRPSMQPPLTLRSLPRFRSIAVAPIGLAIILACSSPGPPPTRPGAPPAPEATPARSTGRWSLQRAPGAMRYEIRSMAMVELAGDSMPGDSLGAAIVVSLSVADSGDLLAVAGTIDSLRLARGARITTSDSAPALPIRLHAVLDRQGGVLELGSFASPVDSLCAATGDALIALTRDLFVSLPPRLTNGTTWQDTTQATSCRGRIPITTTTVTMYTVRGEHASGGRALLAIDRSTTLSLAGSGKQYGRSATVQGTGTGTGMMLIDPATAALIDGQSQSTVTITFEAGMLRQTFTQRGRQDIRRR